MSKQSRDEDLERLKGLVKEGLESPIVRSSTWAEFKRQTLAKAKQLAKRS